MRQSSRKPREVFWPKVVLKKWLNITSKDSDFSADVDEGDDHEFDEYENFEREEDEQGRRGGGLHRQKDDENLEGMPYKLRRRNSETFRAQYINTKEIKAHRHRPKKQVIVAHSFDATWSSSSTNHQYIRRCWRLVTRRVCVSTWNVAGKAPPDNLDISSWLDTNEPADIYVIGFQEIVPLDARNVFGAEDNRPISKWENIIRENLNVIEREKPKYKCFSDPPSPSRFNPCEDVISAFDDLLPSPDSDSEDDIPFSTVVELESEKLESKDSPKKEIIPSRRLSRLNHFIYENDDENEPGTPNFTQKELLKTLSRSERIGLVWPEQPLDLLPMQTPILNSVKSFKASKSFKTVKSFRNYGSYKVMDEGFCSIKEGLVPDFALKKKRSPFVRIISKQMVGVFLTIWVRKSLRKHIQNLKVSTIGVGAMGYIGNKGSISVSMSIYQTLFCFVCTHLSSGEKGTDVVHRNSDVQEIHRRTLFSSVSGVDLPKNIHDHERIFWLGDLNYRIDLSYEKTHELIAAKDWSRLSEKDQLIRELRKGRVFDGWSEGVLNFPPTYKYNVNSEKYIGDDHKGGKRTPAWCDRVLSFGKGMRLLKYRRTEQKLSDHRPVMAIFMAEVEVFSHKKLQKALTLTDAEIEHGEVIPDLDFEFQPNHVKV